MSKKNNTRETYYNVVAIPESGFIASHKSVFNFDGNCERAGIEFGLTMKEAYKVMLDLYNKCFGDEFFAKNWGLAVLHGEANPTHSDGIRSFEDDGVTYCMETCGNHQLTYSVEEFLLECDDEDVESYLQNGYGQTAYVRAYCEGICYSYDTADLLLSLRQLFPSDAEEVVEQLAEEHEELKEIACGFRVFANEEHYYIITDDGRAFHYDRPEEKDEDDDDEE